MKAARAGPAYWRAGRISPQAGKKSGIDEGMVDDKHFNNKWSHRL